MYPMARIFLLFSLTDHLVLRKGFFSSLFRKGQLVSKETVFAAASVGGETQNISSKSLFAVKRFLGLFQTSCYCRAELARM